MPKPTFLRLSAARRQRFLEAAIDEFAARDYRAASLDRIVDAAGIAKGSVYQYFDGKRDLYAYLVARAAEAKFAFIDASLPRDARDTFARFGDMVFHGARFDFGHPREATLLYLVTYEPEGSQVRTVAARLRASAEEYLDALVGEGLARGDLRPDLDRGFAVFVLYQLAVSLRDHLVRRFGFSFEDAVRRGAGSPVSEADLRAVLDQLVAVIRQGMSVPGSADAVVGAGTDAG